MRGDQPTGSALVASGDGKGAVRVWASADGDSVRVFLRRRGTSAGQNKLAACALEARSASRGRPKSPRLAASGSKRCVAATVKRKSVNAADRARRSGGNRGRCSGT